MPAIVLQFATERSLASWAIRAFERGWASHVDTVMPDGRLLGARSDGGVKIRDPDYAPFVRSERVELATTADIAERYYAFVQSQIRKPYDMTAIVAIVANGPPGKSELSLPTAMPGLGAGDPMIGPPEPMGGVPNIGGLPDRYTQPGWYHDQFAPKDYKYPAYQQNFRQQRREADHTVSADPSRQNLIRALMAPAA